MDNAFDIIKILCIKLGKLDDIPRWRFIKKYRTERQIVKLYKDLYMADFYDTLDALSAILIHFHKQSPDIISKELKTMLNITDISIQFRLDKCVNKFINPNWEYIGNVTYTASNKDLDYDVYNAKHVGMEFKFTVTKDSVINKTMESIFIITKNIIKDIIPDIVIEISNIINHPILDAVPPEFVYD